jgi:hypothetical protein
MSCTSRYSKVLVALSLLVLSPTAIAGCAADTAESTNEDEAVGLIRLQELPSTSALREKVEEQNEQWRDENIMTGAVSVLARKVGPSNLGRLDRVAKAAFNERVKDDEVKVRGSVTTTKPSSPPSPKDAALEAAYRIAVEGFVYSDTRENIAPVEDAVKALVDALGPAEDIIVARAEGKVVVPLFDDDSETWRATTYVFANKRTSELVIFYARKGST